MALSKSRPSVSTLKNGPRSLFQHLDTKKRSPFFVPKSDFHSLKNVFHSKNQQLVKKIVINVAHDRTHYFEFLPKPKPNPKNHRIRNRNQIRKFICKNRKIYNIFFALKHNFFIEQILLIN